MVLVGIAVARLRNLFAVVMLTGIFSLTAAVLYVVMDAVDVAFTEAAVGAGISTVLMLGTLALTTSEEKADQHRRHPWALILVLITGAVLIYGTLDMPFYGDPLAAIHNHVAPFYINKSFGHTGLPNIVTSILASYRGFDTLGEVFVIFTAATAILLTLGRASYGLRRKAQLIPRNLRDPKRHDVILRVVSKFLIPVILLFALYVQWHGDFGPGGGFQAGTIFAAAFILYALVFDVDTARAIISPFIIMIGLATGVLLFSLVGVVCMFKGGVFLDYSVLGSTQVKGQHLGILLVELGVGITVSSAMISIFFNFARQKN